MLSVGFDSYIKLISESKIVTPHPKYSLLEVERRWLVEPSRLAALDFQAYREINDRYLGGTQLRLRRVTSASGEVALKFCKKYGKGAGLSEAITNLYLSETEYTALAHLPGAQVKKRRYAVAGGALDVYENPNAGLAVFEVEFESPAEAMQYVPPSFTGREVTHDARYTGAALAQQQV